MWKIKISKKRHTCRKTNSGIKMINKLKGDMNGFDIDFVKVSREVGHSVEERLNVKETPFPYKWQ